MFSECHWCGHEKWDHELYDVCGDCIAKFSEAKAKRESKQDQKVWAVIDVRYGIVGLYATKRLATKACDEGIGLDSGYAGTVRSMVVRKSVKA